MDRQSYRFLNLHSFVGTASFHKTLLGFFKASGLKILFTLAFLPPGLLKANAILKIHLFQLIFLIPQSNPKFGLLLHIFFILNIRLFMSFPLKFPLLPDKFSNISTLPT